MRASSRVGASREEYNFSVTSWIKRLGSVCAAAWRRRGVRIGLQLLALGVMTGFLAYA
jgi:hypothetical protein